MDFIEGELCQFDLLFFAVEQADLVSGTRSLCTPFPTTFPLFSANGPN